MKRDGDEIVAFDRGDVVWGIDPFKSNDDGSGIVPRPWVVLSDESVPFHPEQYPCVTLTSRTWHERSIPIDEDDWLEGGHPKRAQSSRGPSRRSNTNFSIRPANSSQRSMEGPQTVLDVRTAIKAV